MALLRHRDGRDFLLARLPKDSVGAEIGVWQGDFTQRLMRKVRPRCLHLIDPWQHQDGIEYEQAWYGGRSDGQDAMDAIYQHVTDRFQAAVEQGRIVIHRRPSDIAADDLEDGSLDWVYIDGDHRYEAVKQDLHAYASKLKPGGLLCGDDYGDGGWWDGGVKRAVDEFIAQGHGELLEQRARQFLIAPTQ